MLLKSFTWRLLWLTVLAIAHLGAHAAPGRSRIIRSSGPDKIAGRYIIRLDPQATTAHIDTLVQQIVTDNDDFTRPDLSAKVLAVLEGAGAVSAELSDVEVERVRNLDNVLELIEDQYIRGSQSTAASAAPVANPDPYSWALHRIQKRRLQETRSNWGGGSTAIGEGAGVDIFIADTGIDRYHQEFGGRAVHFYSFYGPDSFDDNGHGTHAAGLAAGATRGLAKQAMLYSVKVLGSDGLGSMTSLLAGMNEVYVRRNKTRPAVLSMSVEGYQSTLMDDMVDRLVRDNVAVVVSAGNTQEDACTQSPAHAPSAITVASTNETDGFAWFSNYGSCVDILAPGTNIQSAWPNMMYQTLSGTSTSCPLVSGAVALYRSLNPSADATEVTWGILQAATIDLIALGTPVSTANRLLYAVFQCPAPVTVFATVTAVTTVTTTVSASSAATPTSAAGPAAAPSTTATVSPTTTTQAPTPTATGT